MNLNNTFTFFEILEFRNTNLIIFEILLSIIFLPLIGFLISITKTINQSICVLLTVFLIFNSFILSLYIFILNLKQPNVLFIKISSWINVGNINITYSFLFDSLTIVMLLTVTLISFLVNVYSLAYIDKEANLNRFIAFLSIFTFFMLILISAGNFLLMFLGWEGVGLTSYLLINFFHHRIDANKSAIKAVIVNRIGDFFFFFSIILIVFVFKCLDFILISLLNDEKDALDQINLVRLQYSYKKITITIAKIA